MKLKKHIYRPGDEVWIIKPVFFLRCGYPLTFNMLRHEYSYHRKIPELLALVGLGDDLHGRERERLGAVLAQVAVRQRDFGGPERRIYTNTLPGYQDEIVKVKGKLTVRTGDYYKPRSRMTTFKAGPLKRKKNQYRNNDLTIPNPRGGLDNAKTHVILKTSAGWIEARNVIPAFYRKLCGSDEGAKVFREALLPIEELKGVYAPKVAKKQFELEEI